MKSIFHQEKFYFCDISTTFESPSKKSHFTTLQASFHCKKKWDIFRNVFQTLWISLIRFILHQWKTFLVLLSNKKETILRMADKERKKGKESILLNDFPRRRRHLGGGAKRKGRKHQTNKSLQYIFSSFLTVMNDPSSYEIAS